MVPYYVCSGTPRAHTTPSSSSSPSQAPSVFLSGSYEETGLQLYDKTKTKTEIARIFWGKTKKKKTHGQPRGEERIAKK